jgi:hypothetical protein
MSWNADEAADFVDFLAWHEAIARQPFGRFNLTVEAVLGAHGEITAQDKDREAQEPGYLCSKEHSGRYKPYENYEWYVRELAQLTGAIRQRIADGHAWAAVADAIQFGELLSELDFKLEYEPDFLRARESAENRARANAKRQKWTDIERFSAVEEEYAKNGGVFERAYHAVAPREGVHWKTIKRSHLKEKDRQGAG